MNAGTDGVLALDDFIFDSYAPRLFQVKDIVSLKTYGRDKNNTEIMLANGQTSIVRKHLVNIMPRLPPCFFQARRSCIINLHHVRHLLAEGRRQVQVTLADLSEIMISRKQFLALRDQRGL